MTGDVETRGSKKTKLRSSVLLLRISASQSPKGIDTQPKQRNRSKRKTRFSDHLVPKRDGPSTFRNPSGEPPLRKGAKVSKSSVNYNTNSSPSAVQSTSKVSEDPKIIQADGVKNSPSGNTGGSAPTRVQPPSALSAPSREPRNVSAGGATDIATPRRSSLSKRTIGASTGNIIPNVENEKKVLDATSVGLDTPKPKKSLAFNDGNEPPPNSLEQSNKFDATDAEKLEGVKASTAGLTPSVPVGNKGDITKPKQAQEGIKAPSAGLTPSVPVGNKGEITKPKLAQESIKTPSAGLTPSVPAGNRGDITKPKQAQEGKKPSTAGLTPSVPVGNKGDNIKPKQAIDLDSVEQKSSTYARLENSESPASPTPKLSQFALKSATGSGAPPTAPALKSALAPENPTVQQLGQRNQSAFVQDRKCCEGQLSLEGVFNQRRETLRKAEHDAELRQQDIERQGFCCTFTRITSRQSPGATTGAKHATCGVTSIECSAQPAISWQRCCDTKHVAMANSQWNPCYMLPCAPTGTTPQQCCCPSGTCSAVGCRCIPANWDPVYTSPVATGVIASSPPTFTKHFPVTWLPKDCTCSTDQTSGGCCNSPRCQKTICLPRKPVDCETAIGAKSVKPTIKPASREIADNFKMLHEIHQKYLGPGGRPVNPCIPLRSGASCCQTTVCATPCNPAADTDPSVSYNPCSTNCQSPCSCLRHVTGEEVCRSQQIMLQLTQQRPLPEVQRMLACRRQLESQEINTCNACVTTRQRHVC